MAFFFTVLLPVILYFIYGHTNQPGHIITFFNFAIQSAMLQSVGIFVSSHKTTAWGRFISTLPAPPLYPVLGVILSMFIIGLCGILFISGIDLVFYHTLSSEALANRVYFEKTLKKRIYLSDKNHTKIALFFLDMDGFKKVNDTFGHQTGDELLIHAASLLKSCVRSDDTISRLGGDEFAIIIEHVKQKKYYEQVASRIINMMSQPVIIHNHEINVSFSIGIAVYPDDAKSIDELIKKADSAMYLAKKQGRNQFHFYDPTRCS